MHQLFYRLYNIISYITDIIEPLENDQDEDISAISITYLEKSKVFFVAAQLSIRRQVNK